MRLMYLNSNFLLFPLSSVILLSLFVEFRYFLVRTTPIDLPDTLYMKNLVMFKKWLYIEDDTEERQKARDAFVKFIRPKNTLW